MVLRAVNSSLVIFLSTLSLRRATDDLQVPAGVSKISIHALLAESDFLLTSAIRSPTDFYPRSPCGERPSILHKILADWDFYPRSPCGERLIGPLIFNVQPHFYPRSPCGERPNSQQEKNNGHEFLSTLSLRRATRPRRLKSRRMVFLSTLSLRRATRRPGQTAKANKDFYPRSPCGERQNRPRPSAGINHFYPRSPCGERRCSVRCLYWA